MALRGVVEDLSDLRNRDISGSMKFRIFDSKTHRDSRTNKIKENDIFNSHEICVDFCLDTENQKCLLFSLQFSEFCNNNFLK